MIFTTTHKLIGGGLIGLGAIGLLLWLNAAEKADDKANQQIGATAERNAAITETLKRTEEANEARTTIEQDLQNDDGRSCTVYRQCLRTARTPSNCQRFLPQRETDQCRTAPK